MQIDTTSYRRIFLEESFDHLANLEAALLQLDPTADTSEGIDSAFRAVHSIKGGSDAVGFPEIAQFAHGYESLLDRIRTQAISLSTTVLDVLLEAADMLAEILKASQVGTAIPAGADELKARLIAFTPPSEAVHRQPISTMIPATPSAPVRNIIVTVAPIADAFRIGLDPLPLLRELENYGTIQRSILKAAGLPPLEELDPEQCYLFWQIEMSTTHPDTALLDLFAFVSDNVRVSIETKATTELPATSQNQERVEESWDQIIRFAKFLVDRNIVSPEQALASLDYQRSHRPAIGRLAIESGLLTPEEVFGTLTRMEGGQMFGQTAVSYRLIKEAQLKSLLVLQHRKTPTFGESLAAIGAITPLQWQCEWDSFRKLEQANSVPAPAPAPAQATTQPVEEGNYQSHSPELIAEFCSENEEHLEAIDKYLLTIDDNPTDSEALNAVYRGYHTLKGGAGMLGLNAIKHLAHEAENLLNLAREGKIVLRDKALDLTFASSDGLKRQLGFVRQWLSDRGELGTDPSLPHLIMEIQAFANPGAKPTPMPLPTMTKAPIPEAAPSEPTPSKRHSGGEKETVRVDKDRLDKLINSIGELVIAQSMAEEEFNQLSERTGGHSHALGELSKISRDIQELGLSLRMVPLQSIFQKMARLVRDLSRKMNKPVDFVSNGEETELDKTVVDQLGDPLMHMVRNAIDHGLESPDERVANGKPKEGKVSLKAYHQGGSVYIELMDDGKGLDKDRILKKAIEKGIVAEDVRLSDSEIYTLIFAPGFSTAATVTDVSGRGVGMDVVRRNVELLQGSIHIRTALGKGTTFTIRLPLTLAIMDGLLVGLGDEVFILPLLSVVESFRPRRQDLYTVAGKAELVSVRGETVPLVRLHHLLNSKATIHDPCQGLLVLVEDQGNKYAILIDELLGQMQAVVKSLDTNYRPVEGLAGATILGNGRVAMILDVHGLASLHSLTGYPARTQELFVGANT